MKKVIVIGCPGAGKSTFSKRLRDITKLPLYHLDMIWHKPDKTTISREEFDYKLKAILEKDSYIIDGNYQRTLEVRFSACDTVFLFDIPKNECLEGAKERVGKKRDDMPWIEEELSKEFGDWIFSFKENQLPKIYELLEVYNKNVIIFKSRNEADEYLMGLCIGGDKY